MVKRREFTPKTKKQALERSQGRCEAIGVIYGLRHGERCDTLLEASGVEYDHIQECWIGGNNGIDNCAAVCPYCHKRKSDRGKKDKAKIDRLVGVTSKRRKNRPKTRWPSRKIPSRQFYKKYGVKIYTLMS